MNALKHHTAPHIMCQLQIKIMNINFKNLSKLCQKIFNVYNKIKDQIAKENA